MKLELALRHFREYWQNLVSEAVSQCRRGLQPSFVHPRKLLGQVPALRRKLQKPSPCRRASSPSKALYTRASSTWAISDPCSCGLEGKTKIIDTSLYLGTQTSSPCVLDSTSRPWIGTTDEERNKSNYIGMLALGWAYILSARLVEIQEEGAELLYTTSTERSRST